MKLYCGVNESKWNGSPVRPGEFACIAPVYGATIDTKRRNPARVPKHTKVLQDSGAFSDSSTERLCFSAALDRQIEHGERQKYANQITHRASYDLLIDEMWNDGKREKRRWSESDGWGAVAETVKAAEYMAKSYDGGRVLSAQGVSPHQYLDCTYRVLEWLDKDVDIFGLGGWCISGKHPRAMMRPFSQTLHLVIPQLANAGVKNVHIWGVMDSRFLGVLLWMCDQHGLSLSTDSSGPAARPTKSSQWGYMGWKHPSYVSPEDTSKRGIQRAVHVAICRCWLTHGLRKSEFYKEPIFKYEQKRMFFLC